MISICLLLVRSARNFFGEAIYSKDIHGKRKTRRRVGRLVSVNNQKVALFKYKGTVCAVDEMRPHMGK